MRTFKVFLLLLPMLLLPTIASGASQHSDSKKTADVPASAVDEAADIAYVYLGMNVDRSACQDRIVLETGAKMRIAPSAAADTIGRLRAGTKLRVLEFIDHFDGDADHYVWMKISIPSAHMSALEKTMDKTMHRCGCADNTLLSLHVSDGGGTSIVECYNCEATWPLLADRLGVIDFAPLGGPQIAFIVRDSHPRC